MLEKKLGSLIFVCPDAGSLDHRPEFSPLKLINIVIEGIGMLDKMGFL